MDAGICTLFCAFYPLFSHICSISPLNFNDVVLQSVSIALKLYFNQITFGKCQMRQPLRSVLLWLNFDCTIASNISRSFACLDYRIFQKCLFNCTAHSKQLLTDTNIVRENFTSFIWTFRLSSLVCHITPKFDENNNPKKSSHTLTCKLMK